MATERDWQAYRTAVVDVVPPVGPAFRIVPDAPGSTGPWPDGVAAPVVVVTAWNPDSVHLEPDVNAARQRRLVLELDTGGLEWWPATGRDLGDAHFESGAAVPGLPEQDGMALGMRHGQAAVYVWTPDAWTVVACDGSRRVALGWRRTGVSDPADGPGADATGPQAGHPARDPSPHGRSAEAIRRRG